jgi:hypothetical protein
MERMDCGRTNGRKGMEMNGVQKLSSRVIDYAERMSAMADAAEGKRQPRHLTRWLVLPASGAALYALVRSESFSRGAKEVVGEAKTRASELPEDLVGRVRDATKTTSASKTGTSSNGGSSSSTPRRKTSTSRSKSRRKTTASR